MTPVDVDPPAETTGATGGRWAFGLAVAACAVVLVLMRSHGFDLPLEADEGNYAYIGGRLLEGDRLYVDVWDHQPPGVFVLFASVIAVFGDEPIVFRWLACAFSLATLGFIVGILRRCRGRSAAVCGAVLFALASSDPATAGEGCNREIYMVTLIMAAWWCVLGRSSQSTWSVLLAGLLLGLASLLKTVVAMHWLMLAGWLALRCWSASGVQGFVPRFVRTMLAFGAGPALGWLATGSYFAITDRYAELIDAVFAVNLSYSGSDQGVLDRFAGFLALGAQHNPFTSAPTLWWAGAVAAAVLAVMAVRQRVGAALAMLALLVSGYLAICLPAQFWPHYYYLLVPALVVAIAMATWHLVDWLGAACGPGSVWPRMLVGLYAVAPLGLLVNEINHYLLETPFGITVGKYNSRDFWARAIGRKVAELTDPDDEVFVLSNDASIYYYARRRCASRYTMLTGLRRNYAGAAQRRAILVADLKASLPRLVLVLQDEEEIQECVPLLHEYYGQPIGVDFADCTGEPIMFVLAAKDRPVKTVAANFWDWDRTQVDGWCVGTRE